MTLDEIDIRRDVVERLSRVHIDYYVTGSEAMALHGLAYRQTNDADFVVEIGPADYESRLRPAFEPTYIVSPLERHPPRWLGSAIHVRAVGKADFIIRDAGDWSDSAFCGESWSRIRSSDQCGSRPSRTSCSRSSNGPKETSTACRAATRARS